MTGLVIALVVGVWLLLFVVLLACARITGIAMRFKDQLLEVAATTAQASPGDAIESTGQ